MTLYGETGLSGDVISAAIAVHRELGAGLDEPKYQVVHRGEGENTEKGKKGMRCSAAISVLSLSPWCSPGIPR